MGEEHHWAKAILPEDSLSLVVERDGRKIDLGSLGKQGLRATFELWHNDPRNEVRPPFVTNQTLIQVMCLILLPLIS